MVQNNNAIFFADEKFCYFFYASVIETLGESDFKDLLVSSGLNEFDFYRPTFKPISIFQLNVFINALLSKYGILSSQGICILVGKAFFRNLRRERREVQEIGKIQRRLEQFSVRIYSGLIDLTEILQAHMQIPMRIIECSQKWQVEFNDEVLTHLDVRISSLSYFLRGFFQEYLEWMETDRHFKIEESLSEKSTQFKRGLEISVIPLD